MDLKTLKVALITDSMLAYGGSDRLMFSILKLFPNATIFTSSFNKKAYKQLNFEIKTSFLQHFLIFSRHLNFISSFAFEQFDLKGFDLVLSLSAGPAKAIITDIGQPHIGIILTPPRNLWDQELNVRGSIFRNLYSIISKIISNYMRILDVNLIKRVDFVISISENIKKKVKKVYRVDSQVIYPSVLPQSFEKPTKEEIKEVKMKYPLPKNFLFTLSRLYDYKRIDWNIKGCIKNKQHLCIAGIGPDLKYLKKISKGSKYIHFLGNVSDDQARVLYSLSECFVFCALEDFGIVNLESLAQGKPVIGLNDGGTKEIVVDGKTGKLINNQSELDMAISQKVWKRYNPQDCIKRAHEFDESILLSKLNKYIQDIYEKKKYS